MNNNIYIISLQAKDIYKDGYLEQDGKKIKRDNEYIVKDGYSINPEGKIVKENKKINSYKKFTASLGNCISTKEIESICATNFKDIKPFYTKKKNKLVKRYTDFIINVNFNYSVKEYEERYCKINNDWKKVWVKYDANITDYSALEFDNGFNITHDDDTYSILVIQTGVEIPYNANTAISLPKGFKYIISEDKTTATIIANKNRMATICKIRDLRKKLFTEGFYCVIKGKRYKFVEWDRSTGSSRQGKNLFIYEEFYNHIMERNMINLDYKLPDKYTIYKCIDIAKLKDKMKLFQEKSLCHIKRKKKISRRCDLPALRAATSLSLSSTQDTITISPESILVIPDYESIFTKRVMLTKVIENLDENNNRTYTLHTEPTDAVIKNKIWDGESLLDCSVYGEKYKDKCMLLLRNKFFKSACFQTDIKGWFSDNNITSIEQLNGFTLAKKIEDIRMITTESSIKYTKFGNIKDYLNNISSSFELVKYEKPTKNFDGDMVYTSYQLLNLFNFQDEEELKNFLQPTIDYINKLKSDMRVFRHHLKINIDCDAELGDITTPDELMLAMLKINNKFENTELFKDFKDDVIDECKKKAAMGRILIHGTNATLLSCPIEMLRYAISKNSTNEDWFKDNNLISVLGKNNVMCTKFSNGKQLIGVRSPAVTMGNAILVNNVIDDYIMRYVKLTNEIVVINTIDENIMNALSGADFDSDFMVLSDNRYLCSALSRYYDEEGNNKFLVPVPDESMTNVKKSNYLYTRSDMAELDSKSANSQQLIGEIVNLSAFLNSKLWHMINAENKNFDDEEIINLYAIICELDLLSGAAIDSAKKDYSFMKFDKLLDGYRKKYLDEDLVDSDKNIASEEMKIKWEEMLALKKQIENTPKPRKGQKQEKENLKNLRNKYQAYKDLLKGYKKALFRPHYFEYLKKKKYKDCTYAYKNYDCTMEKIGKIIYSNVIRKERTNKIMNHQYRLLELFNTEKIDGEAYYDQIPNIIEDVTEMSEKCKSIFNKYTDKKTIKQEQSEIKSQVINKYEGKISAKTIRVILTNIEKYSDYDGIKRHLVNVLYKSNKKAFLSLFKVDVESEIETLYRIDNKSFSNKSSVIGKYEKINLYDFEFIVIKNYIYFPKHTSKTLDITGFIIPRKEEKCI